MKVVCEHCGLPFSVGRVPAGRAMYCCSGCALAARVTMKAGENQVVNMALVTALGVGFVFFNQVLGWLLAVSLARTGGAGAASGLGDVENAAWLTWASLAVGVAVWLALACSQIRAGARHGWDFFALLATAGLVACAVAKGSAGVAVAANAALAAWALRGMMRKRGG